MCYYLYILKSIKDSRYYVGIAENVDKRLECHNSGKVRSTINRRPFKVIYRERHNSRIDARNREKFLKSYSGVSEKRRILANNGE